MTNLEALRKYQVDNPGKVCRFVVRSPLAQLGVQKVIEWPEWHENGHPKEPYGTIKYKGGQYTFVDSFDWNSDVDGLHGVTIVDDEPIPASQPDDIDWRMIEQALCEYLAIHADYRDTINKQLALVRAKLQPLTGGTNEQ